MKYRDCISVTMSLINHLLDNNIWFFYNDNNLNRLRINLNSDGFILEEESRFGSDPTYEEGFDGIEIAPSYLIKRLFDGTIDDEDKSHSITMLIHSLPDYEFKEPISYIKIVQLIEKMRSAAVNGGVDVFSYYSLKKYLTSFEKDVSWSLKNHILSLASLDYVSIINISNERKELARKLERMYQVEKLLEKYSKLRILERSGKEFRYNDFVNDFADITMETFEMIDLDAHTTEWKKFCDFISSFNVIEMQKSTKDWHNITHILNYHPQSTVLGLDERILPGTPRIYQKYFK